MGKHEVSVIAVFHDGLNHFFEVLFVVGGHDMLAVIHDDEHMPLVELLNNALRILLERPIMLQRRTLKQLQIQRLQYLAHILTSPNLHINHTIPKQPPKLYIPHQFPHQCTLPNPTHPRYSYESFLLVDEF
jgi:hypothetical protein